MTKNVNIVKGSKLKLFNDFHLIKNRITATQENNSVLACVDCSEKKRAGSVSLNLGIAYANDNENTCVYVDERESNLVKQVAISTDRTKKETIETQINSLTIQPIQLMDNDNLVDLIRIENNIRTSSGSIEHNILPINTLSLTDEVLSEMLLLADQVVLVVSQSDTRWIQIERVVNVMRSQGKKILGYIWID